MSDRVAGVGSRKCEITDEGLLELEGCHPPAASGRDWPACLAAATLALPARDTGNPIEGRPSDTLASLTGASRLNNPTKPSVYGGSGSELKVTRPLFSIRASAPGLTKRRRVPR